MTVRATVALVLGLSIAFIAFIGGCSRALVEAAPTDGDEASLVQRYLSDGAFREAELKASLVNPADGYAQLRIGSYSTLWAALPVWNPRVSPVTTQDLGARSLTAPLPSSAEAIVLDALAASGDIDALTALGERAFTSYPVQILPGAETALASAESAASYGFLTDPETNGVGSLVHVEVADGSSLVAMTCATCHLGARRGSLVLGAPNELFDLGKLLVASDSALPGLVAPTLAWGPGRVDVSSVTATEPARIPDLRPVGYLGWLQQDATVRQLDVVSLAIRLETLIITSHGEDLRPPREIAIGLALMIRSLTSSLPPLPPAKAPALAVLESACGPCHAGEGLTGAPVPLAVVGTDPTLGLSESRGTGFYRVPSLRGVGSRGPLLHDASAPSLDVFFDPTRAGPSFTGGRDGRPVPGHPWNIALDANDRAAVLGLLQEL